MEPDDTSIVVLKNGKKNIWKAQRLFPEIITQDNGQTSLWRQFHQGSTYLHTDEGRDTVEVNINTVYS